MNSSSLKISSDSSIHLQNPLQYNKIVFSYYCSQEFPGSTSFWHQLSNCYFPASFLPSDLIQALTLNMKLSVLSSELLSSRTEIPSKKYFKIAFILYFDVGGTPIVVCMLRFKDNFRKSVLFFHQVGPGDHIHVVGTPSANSLLDIGSFWTSELL